MGASRVLLPFKEKFSLVVNLKAMGVAWVLLLIFMAFISVGDSQRQQHTTVPRLSSALLNSTGWRPNDNTFLVSPDGTFCAGFYNVTPNAYAFAVWYANDSERTLAWMSNSTTLVGGNSSLTLKDGTLSISDEKGGIAWRSGDTPNSKDAMDLILLDSGNLIFNTTESPQWESFKEFPTFTLLPTQNFTIEDALRSRTANGTYGRNNNYYSLSIEKQSNKLSLYYMREQEGAAQKWYWQSDGNYPAVTLDSSGFLNTNNTDKDNLIMASDSDEEGRLRRLTLQSDGKLLMYSRKRNSPSSSWDVVWEAVAEHCKIYGSCGDNAVCKVDQAWETKCDCPPGFERSPTDNRTCKLVDDIEGTTNVTFVALDYVNFDGVNVSTSDSAVTRLEDCIDACTRNRNCMGFAHNLDNGSCVYQLGKLLNGYWSPEAHTRMYLKVSAKGEKAPNLFDGLLSAVENVCPTLLELDVPPKDNDHTTRYLILISSLFGVELLCGVFAFWAFLRKYSRFRDIARIFALDLLPSGGPKKFTYAELKAATNNFSDILGQGGFGPVYRGLLPDQRQIAVKKLEGLQHGEQQFWAEVTIIGRIHHLNLVRMWGFCAEGKHRLLVYEYIPNGSLERHLFNTEGANVMAWGVRYRIALGVARAIAYLHEECLEWVLHCDIKPENILVDESFCPKVSDFGLAKMVDKESSLSVSTIRGTRGYLAPEWFEMDPITAKADVYSFGMVLLEMVSGRRNLAAPANSSVERSNWYFPAWAFDMVVLERNVAEVVDERLSGIGENRSQVEAVERMVKTALWCIQSRAEERPSMGKVAKMLEGTVEIEDPPKPYLMAVIDGDTASSYSGGLPSIKTSSGSRLLR